MHVVMMFILLWQRVVQDRRAKGEELGEKEILVWLLQVCVMATR